jgi:hypothetical protein
MVCNQRVITVFIREFYSAISLPDGIGALSISSSLPTARGREEIRTMWCGCGRSAPLPASGGDQPGGIVVESK